MIETHYKGLMMALYAIRDSIKELQEPKAEPEDPDQYKTACGNCSGPPGAHSLRLQCPQASLDFCCKDCLKRWAATI